MSKRQSFLLLFTAFLFACVLGFNQYTQTERLMSTRADRLTDFVEEQKELADESKVKHQELILQASAKKQLSKEQLVELEELSKETFALLYYKKGEITFWSNNNALPPRDSVDMLLDNSILQVPQGTFFLYEEPLNDGKLFTMIPLQYNFGSEYHDLFSRFTFARPLERGIRIKNTPTPFPVKIGGEKIDFWIEKNAEEASFVIVQWLRLLLYFLFMIAVFSVINEAVIFFALRFGNFIGSTFFAIAISICVIIKQKAGISEQFPDLHIFISKFAGNSFGSSLGDWLITIGIALWLMIFFHREFTVQTNKNFPAFVRGAFAVMYYFAMMACTMIAIASFRTLVFYSGIDFDFDNLLNLNMYGFVGLCGVVLVMAAMFLFSHRMIETAFKLELNIAQRVIALLVSGIGVYGVSSFFSLGLNPMYIVSFCLFYAIIFDYFISTNSFENFSWVVIWITVFALFSSLLLYRYGTNRDENQRLEYAKRLAEDVDTLVIQNLARLQVALDGDPELNNHIAPLHFKAKAAQLHDFILKRGAPTSYLFQHYDFQSTIFSELGDCIVDLPPADFPGDSILRVWEKAIPSKLNPNIRTSVQTLADKVYIVKWDVLRGNEAAHPAKLFAIFYHRKNKYSRIYSDIFFKENFKGLKSLDRYSYEVSQNGQVRYRKGEMGNLHKPPEIPPGMAAAFYRENSNWLETIYRRPDDKVEVRIGRKTGGYIKTVYLFSALFALLAAFMFFLAGINSFVRILPAYYHFIFTSRGSLAKRIQYFTVALIFFSMIVVGVITYVNFKDSSKKKQRQFITQNTENLVGDIYRYLEQMPAQSVDSLRLKLSEKLSQMSTSFQVDVNLYDQKGNLQNSSRPDLFTTSLLQSKMGTNSFNVLSKGEKRVYFEDEQIGNFTYRTKYESLLYKAGPNEEKRPIAYLGMPYFLREEAVSAEVSDFFGKILSVYVFLLLIAAVMTVVTARAITKPLEKVVEKIKNLQLEDKNEPLEIDSDGLDELSALINEYNRMVAKLEESTKNIISLEREGAWRQMARQVAHEITNPLTTMKLSMQQLERISTSDHETSEIRAYLKKTILRQIEQIDGLAQIASEFSMFAKMDLPQKHDIELNSIVQSVFDLFEQREDVDFELSLPKDAFHILGEKNHLIRVFNNLVINATQAFPSDLEGKKVKVSLERKGNMAVIRVKDNGTGIPAEIQEKVFEPNFTTKTSGSGLGLAICKRIIDALDGNMTFETKDGEGTEFFVSLPIAYTK